MNYILNSAKSNRPEIENLNKYNILCLDQLAISGFQLNCVFVGNLSIKSYFINARG
jgi:hypothetical protein